MTLRPMRVRVSTIPAPRRLELRFVGHRTGVKSMIHVRQLDLVARCGELATEARRCIVANVHRHEPHSLRPLDPESAERTRAKRLQRSRLVAHAVVQAWRSPARAPASRRRRVHCRALARASRAAPRRQLQMRSAAAGVDSGTARKDVRALRQVQAAGNAPRSTVQPRACNVGRCHRRRFAQPAFGDLTCSVPRVDLSVEPP